MTNADEWNFDGKKEGDSNDGDESIISDVSDGSQVTANIISVATARVHTVTQESPLASLLASRLANIAELLETPPGIQKKLLLTSKMSSASHRRIVMFSFGGPN
jgi:hypothetical protein